MMRISRGLLYLLPVFLLGSSLRPASAQAEATPSQTKSYDVVVYGATPGGIISAIAAARENQSVVLIDPAEHVGGMTTGGLSRTDVGNAKVIGGLALEFFQKAAEHYGDPKDMPPSVLFYSEPHVAEQAFLDMLDEAKVDLALGERLREKNGVEKTAKQITTITTESGKSYSGKAFVDATYEGDLMAQAGVSYRVGREAKSEFDEKLAGYYPMPIRPRSDEVMANGCLTMKPGYIHGTPTTISALDDNGKPIFGVQPAPNLNPGDADGRTQSYNFRVIVTRKADNRVPFPKPANYDPAKYELLYRLIKSYPEVAFDRLVHLGPVPGEKFDLNAQGFFSTDYPGANTDYPDGDYATRERVWQDHVDFIQGFLWFLGNDPRLSEKLRDQTNEWGLCKDEFADNKHWPYQLYVREGRRMKGEHVLRQQDLQTDNTKPDTIAMGSFLIDCHIVERIVTPEGNVTDEGSFKDDPTPPYAIPYRSITPKSEECANLLVPVCASASHIAYCSLRMEPQYMMMGHAAGLAAAAVAKGEASAVQEVNISGLQAKLKQQGAVLEFAPPGPKVSSLEGVAIDDLVANRTGEWIASNYTSGFNGAYRHDGNAEKGKKAARYELTVPSEGEYEVRFAYVPFGNRATNVPVSIQHKEGTASVVVNERKRPPINGQFVSLGRYTFTPQSPAVIVVRNDGTDGYVAIDAIQLVPVK